jgi:hypothetical protein
VQNTWYTVLAATGRYTKLDHAVVAILTTGETIQMEQTIDGVVSVGQVAAAAGTMYQSSWATLTTGDLLGLGNAFRGTTFIGHDIQVRVRKITATGVGNLQARVVYAVV